MPDAGDPVDSHLELDAGRRQPLRECPDRIGVDCQPKRPQALDDRVSKLRGGTVGRQLVGQLDEHRAAQPRRWLDSGDPILKCPPDVLGHLTAKLGERSQRIGP